MEVVVLISCMHQKDESIIKKSNIRTDVVVVNQCDRDEVKRFTFKDSSGVEHNAIFIYSTTRGLSKSRNIAISNAPYDSICVFCDDDEIFADDYEEKILSAYKFNPNQDLIAFALIRNDLAMQKYYPSVSGNLGFMQILKTSSLQITFKKESLLNAGIKVDEKMGSGTGNGGGEENKFLLDFKRKGLNLHYHPSIISTVMPGDSQWFKGYTPEYIHNLGWSSRRAMGLCIGFLYVNYWIISHHRYYVENMTCLKALKCIFTGYFSKK